MEFDWLEIPFANGELTKREIEESFEDPFSIRLLPEFSDDSRETRYFCLGKALNNKAVFSVFWTDGKQYRVVAARPMTGDELHFYERKNAEMQ
ncbi:MAG: Ribonuclease toxin, BrnT, of type II toxin-antitoxin system [Verrucomicrobia bacterium]|jgi:uncharacterized DUF497 family protein|nr:MAG: Ribonuclease toxin, BrnT, of type II toxin-antitoxin system [Verrucomicrobiota bacterium]